MGRLAALENSVKLKSFSVWPENKQITTEIGFSRYFRFKHFPETRTALSQALTTHTHCSLKLSPRTRTALTTHTHKLSSHLVLCSHHTRTSSALTTHKLSHAEALTRKQRERDREPRKLRSLHHRWDRQLEIVEPTNGEPTNPRAHEQRTHDPWTANPRTANPRPTNGEPMNPRSDREPTNRESHRPNRTGESHCYRSRSRSGYQRVAPLLILFLWFWFFTFCLWSLIFLLLLWWCGWRCFGGFSVVWWWVLCRWWWKITFSEYTQTHENIF